MNLTTFTVLPAVPPALSRLAELAYNLWFSWNPEAAELFARLDPECWEEAEQSPVRMLSLVAAETLAAAAADAPYLADLTAVYERFSRYMTATDTWFAREHGRRAAPMVAYFSCEFGLHQSLPVYSGGLGVLAGDHLKSASDLGVPLVGVGLLYRQGFFRQRVSHDGMQQEYYPENDWTSMPVHRCHRGDGQPLVVSVPMNDDPVHCQVWRVDVGRVPVYLLDANLEVNSAAARNITVRLYDDDREIRLAQEFLLGVGGVMVLRELGLDIRVYHINEGHSAFLLVERIRQLMLDRGLTFAQARELVWATSLFTTHTPVSAGNERFTTEAVARYCAPLLPDLGLAREAFLALGREPGADGDSFCMTALALRLAAFANGVSQLHGSVSRQMWTGLYPGIPTAEVPIGAITNGVHSQTWMGPELRALCGRQTGPAAAGGRAEPSSGSGIDGIADDELWQAHEAARARLVAFVRRRLRRQLERRGAGGMEVARGATILDPDCLTLGFARRFAAYKRGALFLRNPERLAAILLNTDRPVQLVVAGKAHPADDAGKEVIRQIVRFAQHARCRRRIVFLEDYDMHVARRLVQGVDVWLNTPRRPHEASGTSGMKAAMNGVLHLSVVDGWWAEAYRPELGWAIGRGETYADDETGSVIESERLYDILESDVVPCFYDRDADGVPRRWVRMMKRAMARLGETYSARRMLREYTRRYYVRAEALHARLAPNGCDGAIKLAAWREQARAQWDDVAVVEVESDAGDFVDRGQSVTVRAKLSLAGLRPEHVTVEIYHGPLDRGNSLACPAVIPMADGGPDGELHLFKGTLLCSRGGRYGFTVRVRPGHPDLAERSLPGLLRWA